MEREASKELGEELERVVGEIMRAESELMGTSCKLTTVGHNQKYLIMGRSGSDGSLFNVFICFTVHAHRYRASYVLRKGYKLSYGAIAKIFGMSQDTVAGESTGRSVRPSGRLTLS